MIFCTLFNYAYLPQGMALYRSLVSTLGEDFTLYILCMDSFVEEAYEYRKMRGVRLIRLADIETDRLKAAKSSRTFGEFCWTCTGPLIRFVQELVPQGTLVTYVDADIAFFSTPKAIEAELGDGSVFIHEHDFAPEFAKLSAGSGRFNVGVTGVRKNEEGRACLDRWIGQCLDECVMDPAAGKCGDQNYLDEWPKLYPNLVVSKSSGIGRAPWNITKNMVRTENGKVEIDGQPLVFYHYHGLRMLRRRFGIDPTMLTTGDYYVPPQIERSIYEPYVRELYRCQDRLRQIGYSTEKTLPPLPNYFPHVTSRHLLFSCRGRPLGMSRSSKIMDWLYGTDNRPPAS